MNKFLQPKPLPCFGLITEKAYWSNLIQSLLLRVLIAGIGGLGIGVLAKIADFSSMGFIETAFAGSFWVAAFMVPTFKRHVDQSLFWLLLMEVCLIFYQLSIYSLGINEYVLVRLGPIILAGILFVATFGVYSRQTSFLYIVWIACNLPALIPSIFQASMNQIDAIVFLMFNIFCPLVFYFAIGMMKKASFPQQILGDFISFSVVVMCLIPLLLIPVELALRHTSNLAVLQIGGRSYSTIGSVILLLPVFLISLKRWRISLQFIAMGAVVLVFFSSFSRGALIVLIFLLAGYFVFKSKYMGRLVLNFFLTAIILLGVGWFFIPETIFDFGWFWLLRMNVVSNLSTGISFEATNFFSTGRFLIWEIASSLFVDSPLWGHGVGSTPFLIKSATFNEFSYSGMHSLMLTVLVERGLIGLTGLLLVFGRVGYLIYINKNLFVSRMFMGYIFIIFLLFANGTGVELFMNSIRLTNVSITVYIFLLIGYFEYRPVVRKTNIRSIYPSSSHRPSSIVVSGGRS